MSWLWLLPFVAQGVLISIDEFYFHRKRGLPLWELISHPIDTLTFMACLGFALLVPFGPDWNKIYVLLAALSCLSVTKDEFVHVDQCSKSEIWIHSLLFLVHPMLLIEIGLIGSGILGDGIASRPLLLGEFALTTLFLAYQLRGLLGFFLSNTQRS